MYSLVAVKLIRHFVFYAFPSICIYMTSGMSYVI